jgi:uncharacterized damage-inducible protein DinB
LTLDDIQLLYEYDRWANDRVLQSIVELSAEQFTRDLGGSFPSVRDTFVHIMSGEWIWLQYWNASDPGPAYLADLKTRREALFNPAKFPTISEVRSKWAEVEREQTEFLNGLTDEAVVKLLPFRTTEVRLGRLMQHLANHSTYHRGQISLMMRQLGAKPIATDFHEFVLADPTGTRTRR